MEPNKIEKHIQEKFREREITPSKVAWDSITKELDSEEKPSRKGFYWYGIAASVLVLIAFSLFFFKEKDTVPAAKVVVESTDKSIFNDGEIRNSSNIKTSDFTVFSKDNRAKKNEELIIVEKAIATKKSLEMLKVVEKAPLKDENHMFLNMDSILETKVATLIEKTKYLESKTNTVTEQEIDSLLKVAQLEILADKIFAEKGKVDALALLNEVEEEMDQSFREQIFKSLKSRFLKVRTAVADRNN